MGEGGSHIDISVEEIKIAEEAEGTARTVYLVPQKGY